MADASCSSSNAVKGLSRHMEQDRSRQQDRLTNAPQHAARSFHSQRLSSSMSNEFAAFQQQGATLPPPTSANFASQSAFQFHPTQSPAFATFQPPQQYAGFAPNLRSDWIDEFQRMGVSSHPTPVHSLHGQSQMNGQRSLAGPVRPDFFPQHPNFQLSQSFQPPAGHMMHDPGFNAFANVGSQMPQSIESNSAFNTQVDLEQEFENAMNEWMRQNESAPEISDQSGLNAQFNDDLTANLDAASAEPTAQEAAKEDASGPPKSDPELARVAQQLVDSLADNQSEKFKNSEFLAVMRRIASHQLVVQGNDLVETPQPEAGTETASGSHVTGATSTAP